MTIFIPNKPPVRDNFHYLQLVDTLIPLIITFILSLLFINFIGSAAGKPLGSTDQALLYIGSAVSLLFVGFVAKAIDLMLLSEKKLIIDSDVLKINNKVFDVSKVEILYKPKEYRPVKFLNLFFIDVDTVKLKLTQNGKVAYAEINQEIFDDLVKAKTIFAKATLQNFNYNHSALSIFSKLSILTSLIIVLSLLFIYFIVR